MPVMPSLRVTTALRDPLANPFLYLCGDPANGMPAQRDGPGEVAPGPAAHGSYSTTGPCGPFLRVAAESAGARVSFSITIVIALSPSLNGESRNRPVLGSVVLGMNARARLAVAHLGDGLRRAVRKDRKGNEASLTVV